MPSDIYAKHIVDAEQTKCRVTIIVDAEHTMYFLVVCNGTNNYVNHFWADVWKVLEKEEIRMNAFQFPLWSTCNQSKKWRRFKHQYS